jgi:hypothetical protein
MIIQIKVELNFVEGSKGRSYRFVISGNNLKEIKEQARILERDP